MQQDEALAALDAAVMANLGAAGVFYAATYVPAFGASGVPCRVILDRNVGTQGLESGAVSRINFITTFAADIGRAKPPQGARFTITKTAETFVVDRVNQWDESTVSLIVSLDRG